VQLHHKILGHGKPLIILHGLFGMLDNWQTLGRRLGEHFTVFLLDQRNHGRSQHHPDFNYPLLAEDLHQFMERHGMYRANILGHSMGGKVAMQFAIEHSAMVEKLVVVDIGPKHYEPLHRHIFEALLSLDLLTASGRSEVEAVLLEKIGTGTEVNFLLKNLHKERAGGFSFKMNLQSLYDHYDQIVAPIESDHPVFESALFLRGGRSRYVLDADWPQIQRLFPNAVLATIPEAGHWVHAEAPDAFYRKVMDFLLD
jgi:pimeloyl-ACP methyl ester carboxylesterase